VGQGHLEVVQELIERWNRGDRDTGAIGDYLDPAVELESPFSSLAGEPYRGYDGMERWMRDLDEQFAEWMIGLGDIRAAEQRVIVAARVHATGRASEAQLTFPAHAAFDFTAGGRIARIRISLDVGAD
jgi:hypothetical protein